MDKFYTVDNKFFWLLTTLFQYCFVSAYTNEVTEILGNNVYLLLRCMVAIQFVHDGTDEDTNIDEIKKE